MKMCVCVCVCVCVFVNCFVDSLRVPDVTGVPAEPNRSRITLQSCSAWLHRSNHTGLTTEPPESHKPSRSFQS